MKWTGNCEAIVNELDENGKVINEFRLLPGQEIPEYVEKLLAERDIQVSDTPIHEKHKKMVMANASKKKGHNVR